MGKQSGSLYYNGEDHLDIAFMDGERIYNHSKIYKGSTLLWKREVPKYMMLDFSTIYESNLFTSEILKTISSFMGCPSNKNNYQNNEYSSFCDIEYAFGKYFSILVTSTLIGSKAEYTYYICYSEDGYDWEKIQNIQFEDGFGLAKLKRYVYGSNEVLAIITPHSIMFMDAGYNLRTVFNCQDMVLTSGKIIAKSGVMLIAGLARNIVAHGEDFSAVTDDGDFYSNVSKDGYFYKLTKNSDYSVYDDIFRSFDAVNWSFVKTIRVFPDGETYGRVKKENIHVHNGYLYVLSRYDAENETFENRPYIFKTSLNVGGKEEKLFDEECSISFVVNDMIFIKPVFDVYETPYLIKYIDIFDGMQEPETVRITCTFGGTFGILGGKPKKITSADYEADITF